MSFSSIATTISLFSITQIRETNHGANCRTIESASPWKKNSQENQKIFKKSGSPPSSIQPPPISSTHTEDISPEIAEDITIPSQSLQVPTVQPAVLPTAQDGNPVLQTTGPTLPVVSAGSVTELPSADNLLPLVDSSTAPEVDTNSVAVIHSKHYVHSNEKIPRLTKTPTRAQVMNITSNLLAAKCPYTFVDVVPVDVIPSLETLLQTRHFLDRGFNGVLGQWLGSVKNYALLSQTLL